MDVQSLHSWNMTPKEAVALQRELADQVKPRGRKRRFRRIAATDVSMTRKSKDGFAAIVVRDAHTGAVVEKVGIEKHLQFPYVPGLLSFREIPLLLEGFSRLRTKPDVVICDGQGFAHPRRIGLASHLGLWLGVPTIGCAKTRLCGTHEDVGESRGAMTPLYDDLGMIGYVVRTRGGVKPVYVSPGHLCGFETAVDVVLEAAVRYRLPEPVRLAHALANELRKKRTK